MKKVLSVLLVAMLAVSFSTVAFASTGATKDEINEHIKGIELTKLPDKLEYTLDDCSVYIDDLKLTEEVFENMSPEEFESIFESLLDEGRMDIDVDLSGADVDGIYNKYYFKHINNEDCSVNVADPFKFSELKKYGDIDDIKEEDFESLLDEVSGLIYRDYTVDVTYEGFKTSYKIKLVSDDTNISKHDSYYDFVSYDNPSDRPYIIGEDTYETVIYDEDGNEIKVETVDVDTTGMTITLRDKETGELVTFDEENAIFYIDFYHFMNDPVPLRAGSYNAIGTVYTDDFESVVFFDYKITFADKGDSESPITVNKNSTPDSADKNSGKSSTSDTPNSSQNKNGTTNTANGAIQTGEVIPAMILLVFISGAVVAMFLYRKKV